MTVFLKNSLLILVLVAAPAFARSKPPMMPARLAPSDSGAAGSSMRTEARAQRTPVRLGLSAGMVVATPSLSSPLQGSELFAGGRFFSRLWLGGRWYFLPAVGYYRQVSGFSVSTQATNLLEISAPLQYALLRLGSIGILAGVSNRLSWRFTADATGLRGAWTYRLGPAVGINVRLSSVTSLLIQSEFTVPLYKPYAPEWSNQVGLLFGL